MIKRVAVITPGGDSSGMNACIRAIVREGIHQGFELFGVYRGYEGLVEGDIKPLDARSVGGIVQQGGTILRSARSEIMKEEKGMRLAYESLSKNRIDWLIVIGGDGSLKAGLKLSERGIPITGIPASIDNDIYGTDETIGFNTAVDVGVYAVDKIRDTSTSFDRIFLVEVMGKTRGFLAIEVALASGAEHVIIPEIKSDIAKICRDLKEDRQKGKRSAIIIFAEGAGDVFAFAERIEQKTGISTRASSLGYIQRGGSPTGRSRTLGAVFGVHAVSCVKKGTKNKLIGIKGSRITHIPLNISTTRSKKIDKIRYNLVRRLAL